jgi:enamine deaminase RidA (YjgF/YER057c/UK114 family)
MELVTHKKFKSGRLMPWGKGTVVSGAKGFVYLSGNTATAEDYDPTGTQGGGAVGDAAAQWRAVLTNIKSDLEELGSALEHLIRLTFFVKGPFPNGGVLSSPNFRLDVLDAFFAEHCPKHCSYNNPPPSEVIGVAALAHPELVIEIIAVAALPDEGRDPARDGH